MGPYHLILPTISPASCDKMMISNCERLLMSCRSCADRAMGPMDAVPRNKSQSISEQGRGGVAGIDRSLRAPMSPI